MVNIKNISGWIAEWAMLLLCALLPFFFIPIQWITVAEGKVSLIVILLGIAMLGYIIAILLEGGMSLSGGVVLFAGALLPIAYAVSTYFSGSVPNSLVGTGVEQDTLAAACLWFGALALSTLIFSGSPTQTIRGIRALLLGGLVLLSVELVHILFSAFTFGGVLPGQTANPLGDWYQLGVASGFFLFLSLSLLTTRVGAGLWRVVCFIVAVLSFLLLFVVSLPDIWIAIAIVSVLYIGIGIVRHHRPGFGTLLKSHSVWIVLLVVAVLCAVFVDRINSALPNQVRINAVQVRPSLQGTFEIGHHALTGATMLLIGSGPNTFAQDWGLYKPMSVNGTPFWNTDFSIGLGSIPTSFVTLGAVGAIAWLLFALSLLWVGWKSMRRVADKEHRGFETMPEILFVASLYLLSFHVIYSLGPALGILMFVMIGLMLGYASSTQRISQHTIRFRLKTLPGISAVVGSLACAAVVLAATVGVGRVVYAQTLVDQSIMVYGNTKNLARASELISESLQVYPQNDRAQRAAVELGVLELQQILSQKDLTSAAAQAQLKTSLQETINHGLAAVSIDSGNYQNWLELAFLYQQLVGVDVSGAYQNATIAYQKAAAANPTNPLPLVQLAQLQLLENNVVSALQNLAVAVKLKPDLPIAYYLASQAYASQNDFTDAIQVAQQVVTYDSTDALGWYSLGAISYAGGDYNTSFGAIQEALKIEPQYANALYVLGLDYYQLGNVDESHRTFEQLDQLSPNQQIIESILSNLQIGKPPLNGMTSATQSASSTMQVSR